MSACKPQHVKFVITLCLAQMLFAAIPPSALDPAQTCGIDHDIRRRLPEYFYEVIAIGYNDKAGAYTSFGLYYYTGKGDQKHWIYFDDISIGNKEASFSSFRSVK